MISSKIVYQKKLKKEAEHWNNAAANELKSQLPDYIHYKKTLPYEIYRGVYVKKMLSQIHFGDRVLELGCYNGWFSLEMVRKGAKIDAHDIAKKAIGIAKKYYRERKKIEKFSGEINYYVTDLNYSKFPRNKYDKVVVRNVLHHLLHLKNLYVQIHSSLKIGGLILIDDALPCRKREALLVGILLTLLPTDIPYSQKIQRIFKKKGILKRTQNMIEAKGASPFESVNTLIEKRNKLPAKLFSPVFNITFASFIGSITSHLVVPKKLKIGILKLFNLLDIFLVRTRVLRGSNFFLIAKKKKDS